MSLWFHLMLFAFNTALLCSTAVWCRRARYHARLARGSAAYAREARADAKRSADEARAAANLPTVLPFVAPAPTGAPQLRLCECDEHRGAD